MNSKNKYIIIAFLLLIVVGMIIALQFKINEFMKEYDLCRDDFEVIKNCNCLPLEGNYSHFEYIFDKGDEKIEPLIWNLNL